MLSGELLLEIENQFNQFREHTSFLVRERIYKGGSAFGAGLQPSHTKLSDLMANLNERPIPKVYLEINFNAFTKHTKSLKDTLQLLTFIVEGEADKEEIKKLCAILNLEIDELNGFVTAGYSFDPNSIMSEEDLLDERIEDLKSKIEDNLRQLSSSHEWRREKSLGENSELNFEELLELIENSLGSALNISSIENLSILAIMAVSIRDIAASDLGKLMECLLFFKTTSDIFRNDLTVQVDEILITSKDVKDDIEHKLNLKKIQWLIKLHNSVIEEHPKEKYEVMFSKLLYKLSRDAKEEFLWTMLRLAREQRNERLEDISITYANLASILLSINDTLLEAGLVDLSNAVMQAEEIKALDAIDDLGELYSLDNVKTEKLVKAIQKQLDNLKLLAFQIIQMDDIRPMFEMIVQFTDMDSNLDSGKTLEDYLNEL